MHLKSVAIAAALLAAFVLAAPLAHAQDAAAPPPPACVTDPPAAGAARVVSGSGQQRSAPFALDGGAYRVTWTSEKPSTTLSFMQLQPADESSILRMQVILNGAGTPDPATGQTYVYNVKPGSYYLDVRLPAGWSVTLTPITP